MLLVAAVLGAVGGTLGGSTRLLPGCCRAAVFLFINATGRTWRRIVVMRRTFYYPQAPSSEIVLTISGKCSGSAGGDQSNVKTPYADAANSEVPVEQRWV